MHFGQTFKALTTFKLPIFFLCLGMGTLWSCKQEGSTAIGFKLPEQGKDYTLGQDVKVSLDIPKGDEVTGATYLLDGKQLGTKTNGEDFTFPTKDLSLGYKLITAVVKHNSGTDTLTVNIVLKSDVKPVVYNYQIIKTYPHDTSSYTQGLEYHNG
ncbi:MAG: glutaminyl-peptide cyclotransferase, partial [Pedobacter sp.]